MSETEKSPTANVEKSAEKGSGSIVWYALALVFGFIVFAGLYGTVKSGSEGNTAVEKAFEGDFSAAGGQDHAENALESAVQEEEIMPEAESARQETLPEEKIEEGIEEEIAETYATQEEAHAAADAMVEKLTRERVLGDPAAPLKIVEHSSFTCGHCAHFHEETFKKIKQNYIDTGKAYLVFSDFPLNAPAMHASMAARCLPDEKKYFDFVQMLFETQKDWAYSAGYLTILKQNAMLAGLSEDGFTECLQNLDLQQAITARMREAQEKHKVNSTPTIVINDRVVIGGAAPYEDFSQKLDAELAKTPPLE